MSASPTSRSGRTMVRLITECPNETGKYPKSKAHSVLGRYIPVLLPPKKNINHPLAGAPCASYWVWQVDPAFVEEIYGEPKQPRFVCEHMIELD